MSGLIVQNYLKNGGVQQRINDLLKERAGNFTASLMAAISSSPLLAECRPDTVLNAAITAASLDLPINNNLGFAYLIPYKKNTKIKNSDTGRDEWHSEYEAQFQLGAKGFIQLAQRSGQYKTIAATPVYEGQLTDEDPLLGNTYDWKSKKSETIIGYVAMFRLINGFEKSLYMSIDELSKHGKKFSQSFKKGYGLWVDDFDSMAMKTVIKLLISKFGPMSIDMQKAIVNDQAVINDNATIYPDNDELQSVNADEEKKNAIVDAHKNADKTE